MNFFKKMFKTATPKPKGYGNNTNDRIDVIIEGLNRTTRKYTLEHTNTVKNMSSVRFKIFLDTRLNEYESKLNQCVNSCRVPLKCDKKIKSHKLKYNPEKYETRRRACKNTDPKKRISHVIIPCLESSKQLDNAEELLKSCYLNQYEKSLQKDKEDIPQLIRAWTRTAYDPRLDAKDEQYNENTDFLLLEQFERASELFPNEDLELVIVSHIDRLERDLVSKNKSITPKKASLVEHSILSSPRLSSKSRRRSPTISKKLIPFTPSDTRRADRFKR